MRGLMGFVAIILVTFLCVSFVGCTDERPTSDEVKQKQQEGILAEGAAEVGMPSIKNFRELKILKDIYELRDQEGMVTYTYVENQYPVPVHGVTARGGKFTYLGETIGYPIPYATQFSNPQKLDRYGSYGAVVLPQAEPNGLFMPSSAEGTWVLMLDHKSKMALPQYLEPRLACFTYKLEFD